MSEPKRITAGVRRDALHAASQPDGVRVDRIHYPPGGHTHWHLHTGEQVLYGEQGDGWVKFEGRQRVGLGPGQIVHVPIGMHHWHGAAPDTSLVHLAVTAGGDTIWLDEVTPQEYAADE